MTFNYKHSLFSTFIILKARRGRIWKGHIYKGEKKESFPLKIPELSSFFRK